MSDNALLIDHVDAWHDGRGKQIIHIPILLRRAREGQMMLLPILLHHFRPIFSTDAQGMDIRLVLGLLIEVLYLGKFLLAVRASSTEEYQDETFPCPTIIIHHCAIEQSQGQLWQGISHPYILTHFHRLITPDTGGQYQRHAQEQQETPSHNPCHRLFIYGRKNISRTLLTHYCHRHDESNSPNRQKGVVKPLRMRHSEGYRLLMRVPTLLP